MTTVLYVLGSTHCGSTVLGNLLGERPAHVSAGELRAAAARLDARLLATRRLPELARGGAERDAAPLRAALTRLQERVAAVAGADVVVDTSKVPGGAVLLERAPVDLRVMHLVRDSRGVLASHRRRGSPTFTGRTLMSMWSVWNAFAEGRYGRAARRIRYEDAADGREIRLGVHHTVDGNRNRFRTGELALAEDRRWTAELGARDRALALALTGPLLSHYRYVPRRASSSRSWVLDTI